MNNNEVIELNPSSSNKLFSWVSVAALIYLVLVAVSTVSGGFKLFSGGSAGAEQIFAFATNPFVALLLGILATALVQSSSTVTSVIVGLVAGGLPISIAIPMVMGANMGTTITNTFVSMGHIRDKQEFQRAFSAATVHDFFNLLAVAIFLPLEIAFGMLEKIATYLADSFVGGSSLSIKEFNFIKPLTKPAVNQIKELTSVLPIESSTMGLIMVFTGILMIGFSVTFLGKVLKSVLVGKAKAILHGAIGRGPVSGILSGTAVTVMVQSSSTTTSLMIPLAGSGVFTTRQIFPFTLGANIGTTITALLAATSISGDAAQVAMTIALVHVLFNVSAVALIYGVPLLREIPIKCAEALARQGTENKLIAFTYVIGAFFVLPGLMIVFN
ncbi:MAG: sodium-dependent phosphate cotransporter [Moritella sp.]|jgi:sodium-dependent phosphate cotransporter